MGRTPCCSKLGLNKGPWTPEEDDILTKYIQAHGEGAWRTLPKRAGLLRCGKSCRLRWMNYLRPDVKRGQILPDEEDLILRLHRLLGNRWSLIAGRIPGRTDNEIKNYWNTHLSKKLVSQGIDPRTHKPLEEPVVEYNHVQNKASPAASDTRGNYPAVADNIEDSKVAAEEDHSPELMKDSDRIPQTSVTGALNHANFIDADPNASNTMPVPLVFQDTASNGAVNMDPITFIPYSSGTTSGALGLQDHESSLYLRRNSITNSYFVAPPMTDSSLQIIPGSITESHASYEGFPMSFDHNEMQQRQVLHGENHMNFNPITPVEDCDNSDLLSYFLESFMEEEELHQETNMYDAPSATENRPQQFSQIETTNQHGYRLWSIISPASQYP